eukprot:3941317-Rhodomonas_salina.1
MPSTGSIPLLFGQPFDLFADKAGVESELGPLQRSFVDITVSPVFANWPSSCSRSCPPEQFV